MTFEYLERIDRTQQLKFEDFVSHVGHAGPSDATGGGRVSR